MDVYGRLDVVDYNVGLAHVGGVVELPEEEWDRIFAVNLKGCFLTMKHVIPIMEKQGGGSIINISFVAGIRPFLARTTCADHIKALPSRSQALLMNLESFRLKIR